MHYGLVHYFSKVDQFRCGLSVVHLRIVSAQVMDVTVSEGLHALLLLTTLATLIVTPPLRIQTHQPHNSSGPACAPESRFTGGLAQARQE